jgi:transcription elongation factor Elf1
VSIKRDEDVDYIKLTFHVRSRLHSRNGLAFHVASHKLGYSFTCDVCGNRFTQKINLKVHIKRYHLEKSFACEVCHKTFLSEAALESHSSDHSGIRKFKCKICNKAFKTERYRTLHFQRHNSTGSFVCDLCGKGFHSSTKLNYHKNVHTGEKPFKCQFCNLGFTNFPNRLKHVRRMHKEKSVEPSTIVINDPKLTIPENVENRSLISAIEITSEHIINRNSGDPISVKRSFPLDDLSQYNLNEIENQFKFGESNFVLNNQNHVNHVYDASFSEPLISNNNFFFCGNNENDFSTNVMPNTLKEQLELDASYISSDTIFSNNNFSYYRGNDENNFSENVMSDTLKEELELSYSYIREQMNGCDLIN